MYLAHQATLFGIALAASTITTPACAADNPDLGALELSGAPTDISQPVRASSKLFLEASIGSADTRFIDGSHSIRRASFDFYIARRLAPGWRAVLSDRLDHLKPRSIGSSDVLNSIREAHVTADFNSGSGSVDVGRINLRHGPGYGYNPTDFFRDGSLRSITTANPLALRENRLGTVAVRIQQSWQSGSASISISPKLAESPSSEPLSADLGATNNRTRFLLEGGIRLSERVNVQGLLYKEPGANLQPGANISALLGDASVMHGEWAYARRSGLESALTDIVDNHRLVHKVSAGLTHTTSTNTSITLEAQYNGAAVSGADWKMAATRDPAALPLYLLESQRGQELASRRAYLVYLTQRDLAGVKGLDLTGFVRWNADDRSRMLWTEFRYRLDLVDIAVQWQQSSGRAISEYGLVPERRTVQLMVAKYFK